MTDLSIPKLYPGVEKNMIPVNFTIIQAKSFQKEIRNTHNIKMNKYRQESLELGYEFIPLIMETSGTMSEDFIIFLTNMAKYKASCTNLSYKNYLKYMIKSIVIDLQKHIADMIMSSNESIKHAFAKEYESEIIDNNFVVFNEENI